jgi:hypothetical protein
MLFWVLSFYRHVFSYGESADLLWCGYNVMCEDSLETVMRGLDRWAFVGYLLDRSSIHHLHVILGSSFLLPCFQLWGKR